MLVLSTIILLAIAAWLFFNGLNEKRWVDAHIHDETVAADPGLIPDMDWFVDHAKKDVNSLVRKTSAGIQHTTSEVQKHTAKLSETVKQRAGDENDPLGRIVAGTRQKTARTLETGGQLGQRLIVKGGELGHKAAQVSEPYRQKIVARGSELGHKAVEKSGSIRNQLARKGGDLESSGPLSGDVIPKEQPRGSAASKDVTPNEQPQGSAPSNDVTTNEQPQGSAPSNTEKV